MSTEDKIRAWYQGARAALDALSSPGRRGTVEASLVEGTLRTLVEGLWEHRNTSGRSRFPQLLRGGRKPGDRQRLFNHGLTVPAWGDISIDEWEGPDGKGVSLNFWVTETDATEWVIRLTWNPGPEGSNLGPVEWTQIEEEVLP